MRQILFVLFLFLLIGTASAGTQIKTGEYYRGQDQVAAVTATAVNFISNAVSIVLPESNIIVKDAWIEVWKLYHKLIRKSNFSTHSKRALDIHYGGLGLV